MKNPAAGGGHWVEVQPGRFPAWVAEFGRLHGGAGLPEKGLPQPGEPQPGEPQPGEPQPGEPQPGEPGAVFIVRAADGAVAECHPPFPPVPLITARSGVVRAEAGAEAGAGADTEAGAEAVAAHALAERTTGVLLARLGGYAVGVFAGSPPRLTASKTGSRPVHGRSAAGGWSQHRFARRREKQASEALQAAADAAAAVFAGARLDAVVLGGDRRAIAGLADDPRLTGYLAMATDRFLTVPDPRLAVLRDTPRAFLAIRVRVVEPEEPDAGGNRVAATASDHIE